MKVGILNTAFVGDVALMGQLIDALSLARHEIVVFSNAAGCSLFEFDPRVSETVKIKKEKGVKKLRSAISIASQVRACQLDVLLVAHKSLTSAAIAILSGVDRKIGYSGASILNTFFETAEWLRGEHESRRYLELCKSIVDSGSFCHAKLRLYGDVRLPLFRNCYPHVLDTPGQSFFICSPGSVWPTKRYPPRHLARLIVLLLEARENLFCVLSGGPQDTDALDELINHLRVLNPQLLSGQRVLDARTCLPLSELTELTRKAAFVLTPDSAPVHIASGVGTPTFAIFGPTSAETGFAPLAPSSRVIDLALASGSRLDCQPCSRHGHVSCPLRHHRCLADLSPDAVAEFMLTSLPKIGTDVSV